MRTAIGVLALIASATLCAQPMAYTRGQQVRVVSLDAARPPATAMALTVVAVPQDRLSIDRASLFVNGVRVMQFSPEFLSRVVAMPDRVPGQLPDGHYFVMGEQRLGRDIKEYWGQHSTISLQPVR
jgi:hypothetical protein